MTENTQQGRRILGTLAMADGAGVVRIEDRFATGAADLWSALTEPDRLARWLGEVDGDLRLGGQFFARFHDGWEGTGRIESCDPPYALRLSVRDADADPYGADGTIEISLTADGEQTLLIWEERGMPLQQIAAYGAGMQVHVEDLADHLAGRERADAATRWRELIAGYADLAATISD